MRSFNEWMDEYGESHNNPTNQMIHKICVPLIFLSILGMIWSIPVPEAWKGTPFLNWATVCSIPVLIFYLTLNVRYFVGMLAQILIMLTICSWLDQQGILLGFSIIVFILAWIGQFYGHKVEGKKPSFLKDLLFLLIGPLWVTRFLFQKIGIKS